MRDEFHDVEKVAYSSVVGQCIMLLDADGQCIGQLAVHGCQDAQDMADQIVAALKAPNRHAYKLGVAVGKAWTQKREKALNDLADLGQEFDAE